jgi:hypothetical protein
MRLEVKKGKLTPQLEPRGETLDFSIHIEHPSSAGIVVGHPVADKKLGQTGLGVK